eukprot:TRINITY_DN2386_c0_g1_i2.p1 TRINITY_DN2386_c0_g1~~TRINITY_DN2386_c0_g1_i2.p1  ORF type:complete len:199 (+),score=42.69 TRINITY_DN2386_c0_g1_i2:157-753(+)
MPRYYCDYCDTYLTHDSANVRAYYQQFEEQQTQSLIDQRVKEHLGQTFQQQVGAAFQQHLAAIQAGQRPRLPVMAPPTLQAPGAAPMSALRPPLLPRPPVAGTPGYTMPMGTSSALGPPGAPVTSPPGVAQPNGLPRPPTLAPPVSTAPDSMSNGLSTNSSMPGASVPMNTTYGNYSYTAPPTNYPQQSSSALTQNSA